MSDEQDKSEDSSNESREDGPVGGQRLAEARRERQIAVIEIAKELHLDEHKVRALERNEFDVLGAPVFAKGHLRKYAQLVDVDEADIMTDYYTLNRSEPAPPVVSAKPLPRPEVSLVPWIAGIVAVLLAVLAYWWFFARTPASVVEQADPAVPQVESAPATSDPIEELVESVDDPVVEAIEIDDVPPEPTPEPASGEIALRVNYLGDCWTEITDGRGRRLFFDLGTAGRSVDLSGEPPLNILFGDADNVSIEVDGAPYDIPASSRRGQTARLTLAGS